MCMLPNHEYCQAKLKDSNIPNANFKCITVHPGFPGVCLFQPLGIGGCLPDIQSHKWRYRYVAYRQFVRWIWRYLGRKIRVVIPACAVSAIRKEFDSDSYKGFKLPDIQ
ncbi:hypothetical protein GWK47_050419 [Chionoecetes opilio]|uniref:P2X purinoreceptor 7 intracellular domain-containing protein n=1 Tax=Chionoecetes opilio TaxID=41210 RepID=A0A8J5CTQ0_CHIOP|nr:hypothetical protein GWK47_050419 [Chionoecetes opilio]